MNCCELVVVPSTKTVSTCSVFHFSMKLSSWAWAAEVSEPVTFRMAVLPIATPSFWRPGTTLPVTTLWLSCSPSTPTLWPSRVCWAWSNENNTASTRSGVDPGRMIRPGGDWFMIAWVSWNVMRTVLWSLARHVCASPVKSTNVPKTANTLSSSVNDVHRVSTCALPMGQ